jgi:hypothetical protein
MNRGGASSVPPRDLGEIGVKRRDLRVVELV